MIYYQLLVHKRGNFFLIVHLAILCEPQIYENTLYLSTMIPIRTTALIATMSLLGVVAPAAFAQSNSVSIGDISQFQEGSATATSEEDDDSAFAIVDQDQGFCINIAQAAAAGGSQAFANAGQTVSEQDDGDAILDCS